MFSQQQRCHYRRSPLSEVICQLRFPDSLSISANPPAAFQEASRDDFPEYTLRRDVPPPRLREPPGISPWRIRPPWSTTSLPLAMGSGG